MRAGENLKTKSQIFPPFCLYPIISAFICVRIEAFAFIPRSVFGLCGSRLFDPKARLLERRDGRSTQRQLEDDGGDVADLAQPGDALHFFGNKDGVAGMQHR